MFFPPWLVFFLFIAGAGAMILGLRKLGVGLMTPALLKWFVGPALAPLMAQAPWWLVGLVVFALPFVLVFGAVKALQGGVTAIFGPRAAGHVSGVYLVRIFDRTAAAALWVLALPFRFIAGRRRG